MKAQMPSILTHRLVVKHHLLALAGHLSLLEQETHFQPPWHSSNRALQAKTWHKLLS